MSRKKAVLIQAAGGWANTIISVIRGLLLLPIYLKYINLSVYGHWISIYSFILLLTVVNFGVSKMSLQRMSLAFGEKKYQSTSDYFINSLIVCVFISIVFILLGFGFYYLLDSIFNIDEESLSLMTKTYIIALTATAISFYNEIIRSFSQSILKPFVAVASTNISRVIGVLFILLFIGKIGILTIPISLLIAEICAILCNGVYYLNQLIKFNVKLRIDKAIIKEYFNFSPMLFGSKLGNNLYTKAQPIIIMRLLGPEFVASYDITNKILNIISQMLNVFNVSLIGPFSHLVGEGDFKRISETINITVKTLLLTSFFTFGMYAICNFSFISLWIGEDIVLNNRIINLLSVGALFSVFNRLFRNLLFGLGNIKLVSNIVLIDGLCFVLLAYGFVHHMGISGLPVAAICISIIETIVLVYLLKGKIELKIGRRNLFKMLVLMIIVTVYVTITQRFINAVLWRRFFLLFIISCLIILFVIFKLEKVFIVEIKNRFKK